MQISAERKMPIVGVKMYDVEIDGTSIYLLQRNDVIWNRIAVFRAKAERSRAR